MIAMAATRRADSGRARRIAGRGVVLTVQAD